MTWARLRMVAAELPLRRLRVSWSVTLVVVIPLLTVFLPQRFALPAQALLVVGVLGATALGTSSTRRRVVAGTPTAVVIGLGAYAAAAGWGLLIGLMVANPVRYVVSQMVSMMLLPLGFLAYRSARTFGHRAFAEGLSRGLVIATAVHLSAFVLPWLRAPAREEVFRFVLRNNVSVLGSAVLGCIVLAAYLGTGHRSRMTVGGAVAAAILVLGGMSRGAWISVVVGLVVIVTLGRPVTPVRSLLGWVAAGAVALLGLVAIGMWTSKPTPIERVTFDSTPRSAAPDDRGPRSVDSTAGVLLLEDDGAAGRRVRLVDRLEVPTGSLEATWDHLGGDGTTLNFTLVFEDEHLSETRRFTGLVVGTGRWTRFQTVVAVPPGSRTLTMWMSAGRRSETWRVDNVEISAIRSGLGGWARQLQVRASSLLRSWATPASDGGARYRIEEAGVVVSQLREASWSSRLRGAGLGAMIPFDNLSWDDRGRRVTRPAASYLHNFYLFLVFKLGLMGVVALGGLVVLVTWTVRCLVRFRSTGRTPAILLGASAAWIAFLLWSVTSPEIYDFMMAPLWGAVVAACVARVEAGGIDDTTSEDKRAVARGHV